MKKLTVTIAAILSLAAIHATELPNGMSARVLSTSENADGKIIEAWLAENATLETKYGSFTLKANTPVTFYDSGSVKEFFITDRTDVTLSSGTYAVASQAGEKGAFLPAIPLVLDENGNFAAMRIAAIRHGKGEPVRNVAKTAVGQITLGEPQTALFHPDGSLKKGKISGNHQITINGTPTQVASGTIIAFYEDGKLMEYAPSKSVPCYEFKSKPKKPVILSEKGNVISFVPEKDSLIDVKEQTFKFAGNEPVELNDDGQITRMTLDCTGKDFSLSGFDFFCKTPKETIQGETSLVSSKSIAFEFYADGVLKSAKGANFTLGFNDKIAIAEQLETYPSGKVRTVRFSFQIPAKDKEGESTGIWRQYFREDGTVQAMVTNNLILLVKPDGKTIEREIFNTGYLADKNHDIREVSSGIHSGTEIIFDENGNPAAYTVYETHDEIRLKAANPKVIVEEIR